MYNALGRSRTEVIPLPVDSFSRYEVEQLQDDMEWVVVDSVLIPNPNYIGTANAAKFVLHFKAGTPPLGASVFRVKRLENKLDIFPGVASSRVLASSGDIDYLAQPDSDLTVSNGVLSLSFDR